MRNAVEVAHKAAAGWGKRAAHNRAQIVYYMAENLELRRSEIAQRLADVTGRELKERFLSTILSPFLSPTLSERIRFRIIVSNLDSLEVNNLLDHQRNLDFQIFREIFKKLYQDCLNEVDLSINRLFYWGAYADKFGGNVQETTLYGATVCIREPVGVV